MSYQANSHTKQIIRWSVRALCLLIALTAVVGLANPVAAEGPADKEPMVQTSDFPAPEEVQATEGKQAEVPEEQIEQYCTDSYEYDDTRWSASPIYFGSPQRHAFCYGYDRDFVQFSGSPGITYDIMTYNLGRNADTVLELYDSGGRLIRSDDDSGPEWLASRIRWTPSYGDTFFVLARQYRPWRSGSGTNYTIMVRAVGSPTPPTPPGPSDRIWVNRGCGSTYSIGDPIRVYMQVSSYGYYRLNVNTDWGTRTSWNGYLSAGTYTLSGQVGRPVGRHTLVLHGGMSTPSCTFEVVGPFFDDGAPTPSSGDADQVSAQELPEAEALDAKELEW